MPYAHKRQAKVAYVIPARVRGRPHPNPPPRERGFVTHPLRNYLKTYLNTQSVIPAKAGIQAPLLCLYDKMAFLNAF